MLPVGLSGDPDPLPEDVRDTYLRAAGYERLANSDNRTVAGIDLSDESGVTVVIQIRDRRTCAARLRRIAMTACPVMRESTIRPPLLTGRNRAPGSCPRIESQSPSASAAPFVAYAVRSLRPLPARTMSMPRVGSEPAPELYSLGNTAGTKFALL